MPGSKTEFKATRVLLILKLNDQKVSVTGKAGA